jgi:hypothetical protein
MLSGQQLTVGECHIYSGCSRSKGVSGRSHIATWAGCIVSLTTPTALQLVN